ncbi:MAG: four helix bundle protein [Deltaproteobacteria bacterium]|nr:four helix bundle protein [Deltaproteobacteria bacterium]
MVRRTSSRQYHWSIVKSPGKQEVKSFEDLEVWKACRTLRRKIFEITRDFPAEEKYGLARQMRDAAISSTANIAEGYGRFHYQENIQFCRQSRGSLYEILDHLTTAVDQAYISQEHFDDLKTQVMTSVRLLNGYLRMLQKTKLGTLPR